MSTIEPESRHLVAAIPRGASEEVRVYLCRFKGRPLCDVRLWRHRGEDWIPERRGISLRPDELLVVADGLGAAMVALQEPGEERRT